MLNFNLPILQANTTGLAPGSDGILGLTAADASTISRTSSNLPKQLLDSLGVFLSNLQAELIPAVM
ncbi:hypothetical protein PSHT_02595 [Puccinia striiformis]|uniref:Uncharacterized protein n=1 Tax=Puccinia striiformis TaxID=27350 RepID=A0A2S4WHP9_9BASI|nr:hypothetical protein PSHT_02595 [Puccinia striiformis]